MSELIDRQASIDALNDLITGATESCFEWIYKDDALEAVKQLPSAEPKIIHCEDCKYGILEPSFPHQWFCKFKGDEWNNSDYFCGHARKREVTE